MGWFKRMLDAKNRLHFFTSGFKIQIREGKPDDAAMFSNLHAQGFERGWGRSELEELLCEKTVFAHMAETGSGTSQGFIMSRIGADEAEILSVAVAKNARRRGVGAQLLSVHLSTLAQSGAKTVFLEVDELNPAAIALYKHFGFEIVGKRKAYYNRQDGSSPSALVMKRCLK